MMKLRKYQEEAKAAILAAKENSSRPIGFL